MEIKGSNGLSNVFSFDIFDTCITRSYYLPSDLFIALARETLQKLSEVYSPEEVYLLAHKRSQAESRARSRSAREDITLVNIYSQLEEDYPQEIDFRLMLECEQRLELECAVVVPSTFERYRRLIEQGSKVIFISDMYLPASLLVDMLTKCGYSAVESDVYVSGDLGLSKRAGALFEHVLKLERILASNLTHFGDNLHSDVEMALKHGIAAVHIDDIEINTEWSDLFLHRRTPYLKVLDFLQQKSKLCRRFYRAPITILPVDTALMLSQVASASRLTAIARGGGVQTEVAASVAAPLLTSFVSWLLNQAREKGLRRLYFVARNRQLLYKIARKLCRENYQDTDCHYLYGSRSAWYLADFNSLSEYYIRRLIANFSGLSVRDILRELSFSDIEANQLAESAGLNPIEFLQDVSDTSIIRSFSKFQNVEGGALLIVNAGLKAQLFAAE